MTRREEILQHAIECGCIEGTAEYYGFLQGAEDADRNPKNPWISVEDRLPEEGDLIFAMTRTVTENAVFCGFSACKYTDGKFLHENNYSFSDNNGEFFKMSNKIVLNDVTRWMPIPGLPKGGDK